ncbi:hypothetical protein J7L24_01825 [bacterium]|nr:hypothetical protein [bacterium]
MFDEIKTPQKDNNTQASPIPSENELIQKSAPPVTQPPLPKKTSPISTPESSSPPAQNFAVPELIKKDIIKKVDDGQALPQESQSPKTEEKIYVMPEKFKQKNRKSSSSKMGSKKRGLLLPLIILFILLIGGGIYFYFWAQKYYNQPETPEVLSKDQEKIEEELVPEEGIKEELLPEEEVVEEEIISEEQTIKAEVKNEAEKITSWAELYLPAGAIDPEIQIEITGDLSSENKGDESYSVIGAVYQIEPADDLIFLQTVALKMFYHQDLVEERWEEDIAIGYFKNNLWTPLSSSIDIDIDDNIVSADLDFLPSNTLALIVEKSKMTPTVEEFQIAPNISSSTDDDNDGLTNIEEAIFRTEINNPDSDADSMPDGQEILALMDPLTESDKIATSGMINIYTNPTFAYSFFYPASWLARAIPETNNQEVLVITNTGEFFSVTVENNPEKLNPKDWYLRQAPDVDSDLLFETVVNNQSAIWSQDHLTIYISKEDKVYILSYMVGASEEANFKTTFQMLINSFQFIVQPQGRANGTLIKYPDQPEIYLIENNQKRAFESGEIFEKLGFKWEDVIEIPLSETYVSGTNITGYLDGTLIKYPDQPEIYLIENNQKRAFKSGEIFESLGFKWEDVIEIPVDEIYPDGPIIEGAIPNN